MQHRIIDISWQEAGIASDRPALRREPLVSTTKAQNMVRNFRACGSINCQRQGCLEKGRSHHNGTISTPVAFPPP